MVFCRWLNITMYSKVQHAWMHSKAFNRVYVVSTGGAEQGVRIAYFYRHPKSRSLWSILSCTTFVPPQIWFQLCVSTTAVCWSDNKFSCSKKKKWKCILSNKACLILVKKYGKDGCKMNSVLASYNFVNEFEWHPCSHMWLHPALSTVETLGSSWVTRTVPHSGCLFKIS